MKNREKDHKWGRILISGASSGIGLEFAMVFAAKGKPLFLLTKTDSQLLDLQANLLIQFPGLDIQGLAGDLSQEEFLTHVCKHISDQKNNILTIINNAGFGTHVPFEDDNLEQEIAALKTMTLAPLMFSHALIRKAKTHKIGETISIINISSVSSFLPRGNYGAIKAWVSSFSSFLFAYDLKDITTRVTWSCPGLTRNTNFQKSAGIDGTKWPTFFWIDSSFVVKKTIQKHLDGGGRIIPGLINKIIYLFFCRLIPFNFAIKILSWKKVRVKRIS